MKKRKLDLALQGQNLNSPPLWLMRQAGRFLPEYRAVRAEAGSFLDLCYTPDLAAEVTLQPIRRFAFDAAIIFSDILVIADALGQKVWFADGEGPRLEPIQDRQALQNLSANRTEEHLQPVFEVITQTRAALPEVTSLIGFCGAPFTVATYMIAGRGEKDLVTSRKFAKENPELFMALLDLLAETSALYLARQVAAGADVVQIFDSWIGILDPTSFEKFGVQPMQKLVSAFRKLCPDIPVIAFPRGGHVHLERFIEAVAPSVVSLDWTADLAAMKARFPSMVFQGNLDPLTLTTGGEGLAEETESVLRQGGASRFIFNLGHGIRPETPIAAVEQLVAQVRAG